MNQEPFTPQGGPQPSNKTAAEPHRMSSEHIHGSAPSMRGDGEGTLRGMPVGASFNENPGEDTGTASGTGSDKMGRGALPGKDKPGKDSHPE